MMNRRSIHYFAHNGKSPRELSSDHSPYLFRRETKMIVTDHPYVENFGSLITPKMKEREGFVFKEAPDFYRMDNHGRIKDGQNNGESGTRSFEDVDEDAKKQEEKEGKRSKNKAPTVKELRDYKRKLISVHAKDLEQNFPSAYPILGLKDDETEEGGEGHSSSSSSTSKKNDSNSVTTTNQTSSKKRKRNPVNPRPASSKKRRS